MPLWNVYCTEGTHSKQDKRPGVADPRDCNQ